MADQLTEAADRLQRMLTEAFGLRHPAIDDFAVVLFAVKDARRYRWLRDGGRLNDDGIDGQIVVAAAGGEDILTDVALDLTVDACMADAHDCGVAPSGGVKP
jgi:hypothetical protein